MDGDEALYEIMRTQMGLDPADCDKEMVDALRAKFSARKQVESAAKPKKKKASRDDKLGRFAERVKGKQLDEPAADDAAKADIDLGDILANIGGGDAVNTTKVKK